MPPDDTGRREARSQEAWPQVEEGTGSHCRRKAAKASRNEAAAELNGLQKSTPAVLKLSEPETSEPH